MGSLSFCFYKFIVADFMNDLRLIKWFFRAGPLLWIMVFGVGVMIMSPVGSIFFTYNQRYFFELPLTVFLAGAYIKPS